MANKNLKKIALVLGASAAGVLPLSAQSFNDAEGKFDNISKTKIDSNQTGRLNIGAGYYPQTENEGFVEASYQVGNGSSFIGPYVKVRNDNVSSSTDFEEFQKHIINNMYAVTDQYTETTNFNSRPIEAGLKLSQKVGPLELSLNAGLTQTEKWAKKAIYGYDKVIDNAIEVRNEEFKLPVETTDKTKSLDFSGSAEILVKPFQWLGVGAGVDLDGNSYLTGRVTFGGRKKWN